MRSLRFPSSIVAAFLFTACLAVAFAVGCNSDSQTGSGGMSSEGDNGGDAGSATSSTRGSSALQGSVEIDGSSTVFPLSEAIASDFGEKYPNVKVTVGESGTGGGFKRFGKGETDISNASRPIKWEENVQCTKASPPVEYIELPIAYDGLTFVVNRENDWVDQLTIDQLKLIYLEGGVSTWKEVDPAWPDLKIQVYSPGTDSGTFDFFKEVMVGSDTTKSMRRDMSTNEDDNVLVTGVAGDKPAIGYFGASYYFNNKAKLKAVRIVNPATSEAVTPTHETILQGTYAPFSRPLFIYVKSESLRRPEMQKFVSYFLEHGKEIAEKVDFVGLDDEIQKSAAEHYRKKLTGTHFWTAAGEKRTGSLAEVYTAENLAKP